MDISLKKAFTSCLITFKIMHKQPPEKFCKKMFWYILISQYSREATVLETFFNSEYCEIF